VKRVARARGEFFARHSHPLSAWSRWATTPLLLLPLWTRNPTAGVGVVIWFAVNPVMTPPPRDHGSFATRAILGEEQWMIDRSLDPSMTAVNAAGTMLLVAGAVAAWQRRPLLAAISVGATMSTVMYAWRRYAALHDALNGPDAQDAPGVGPGASSASAAEDPRRADQR
jgi:hypothetical protein